LEKQTCVVDNEDDTNIPLREYFFLHFYVCFCGLKLNHQPFCGLEIQQQSHNFGEREYELDMVDVLEMVYVLDAEP